MLLLQKFNVKLRAISESQKCTEQKSLVNLNVYLTH